MDMCHYKTKKRPYTSTCSIQIVCVHLFFFLPNILSLFLLAHCQWGSKPDSHLNTLIVFSKLYSRIGPVIKSSDSGWIDHVCDVIRTSWRHAIVYVTSRRLCDTTDVIYPPRVSFSHWLSRSCYGPISKTARQISLKFCMWIDRIKHTSHIQIRCHQPNVWGLRVFFLNIPTAVWFPWKPIPLRQFRTHPRHSCQVWCPSARKRRRRCGTNKPHENSNYSMIPF